MLSMFTHLHVVLNAFDSLSSMQPKRRSLDECPCCMVPYNVNEWGQMLSRSKKKSFEGFMNRPKFKLFSWSHLHLHIFAYLSAWRHLDLVCQLFGLLFWCFSDISEAQQCPYPQHLACPFCLVFQQGLKQKMMQVSHNKLNALSLSLQSTVIAWQMTETAWKQAILWTDGQNMLRSDNIQCTPVAFSHCSRHKYRWHTHRYTLSEENRCQLLSTPTV